MLVECFVLAVVYCNYCIQSIHLIAFAVRSRISLVLKLTTLIFECMKVSSNLLSKFSIRILCTIVHLHICSILFLSIDNIFYLMMKSNFDVCISLYEYSISNTPPLTLNFSRILIKCIGLIINSYGLNLVTCN